MSFINSPLLMSQVASGPPEVVSVTEVTTTSLSSPTTWSSAFSWTSQHATNECIVAFVGKAGTVTSNCNIFGMQIGGVDGIFLNQNGSAGYGLIQSGSPTYHCSLGVFVWPKSKCPSSNGSYDIVCSGSSSATAIAIHVFHVKFVDGVNPIADYRQGSVSTSGSPISYNPTFSTHENRLFLGCSVQGDFSDRSCSFTGEFQTSEGATTTTGLGVNTGSGIHDANANYTIDPAGTPDSFSYCLLGFRNPEDTQYLLNTTITVGVDSTFQARTDAGSFADAEIRGYDSSSASPWEASNWSALYYWLIDANLSNTYGSIGTSSFTDLWGDTQTILSVFSVEPNPSAQIYLYICFSGTIPIYNYTINEIEIDGSTYHRDSFTEIDDTLLVNESLRVAIPSHAFPTSGSVSLKIR